ncbi:hypothetical protein [Sporosarcina ureilytica]|uniref:Uncharacterized protein n=1 Tax=Sporosarcina ureilytica TaxID=298596 RepID=A0A1D8JDE0_9BACL|nr:hypothetical protein [Sporosarcina ureilytica]AOV06725.1 hypothetical protein BI350_03370 [Sporosarcina ureilytica]
MLLLWYASLLASLITIIYGISHRSWLFMLISAITFSPISYYFLGINIALKYVGLTPIILLVLAVFFGVSERRAKTIALK